MLDSTTLASYIKAVVEPEVTISFNNKARTWGAIPEEPYSGEWQKAWNIKSDDGAIGAIVPEGGAAPAPTDGTTRQAVTGFITLQKTADLSGEIMSTTQMYSSAMADAMDSLASGMARAADAFIVGRLVTDIAAAGNVYGLNRAANNLVSLLVAGGGIAVTEAGLAAAYNGLLTGFREDDITDVAILSTPGQQQTYTALAGIGAAAGIGVNFNLTSSDLVFDTGRLKGAVSYNGRPWITCSTLTNTEIYFLHMSMARRMVKQQMTVIPLARTGYPMQLMAVMEVGFKYTNPGKASYVNALLAA